MVKRTISGNDFRNMIMAGARRLQEQVTEVNSLNVFPVPDGDTGTNMSLTLSSGVQEMASRVSDHLGQTAEALSKGLLMGARGNSGVILSQLFRGFAKAVAGMEQADARQLANALQQGVDTAYKAVVKPVEGTILSVSKKAALHAVDIVEKTYDIVEMFHEVTISAQEALKLTPDQLPILKQAGVIDSGGKGLVLIYEGFVQALRGERIIKEAATEIAHPTAIRAQAHLHTGDIEYGYCTEFIVRMSPTGQQHFDELEFRNELGNWGDSLLVVADEDLVKVHIHSEIPGTVMNHAMKFGELTNIKIDNMREQHAHLLLENEHATMGSKKVNPDSKECGLVSVTLGEGITNIFRSLGVSHILTGGQTMNPSTEDILKAISEVNSNTVFVLPNNPNIFLAAQQAKELSDKKVVVIPTKTIPQGISAVVSFMENANAEQNEKNMLSAIQKVASGSITHAIRDSQIGSIDIRKGEYLALLDNEIVGSDPSPQNAAQYLLESMIQQDDSIVTIFCGKDAKNKWTEDLRIFLDHRYPDVEVEICMGGQPVYEYIISVE